MLWPSIRSRGLAVGEDKADCSLAQFPSTTSDLKAHEWDELLFPIWKAERSKEALPYIEKLIALFDRNHNPYSLPIYLERILVQMRPDVIPILVELKNDGGDIGRRALQTLPGVQEWHNIDATDQTSIRTLIQDGFGHQHQNPPTLDSPDWMAMRTEDHDALIEALGFGDSMPITKNFGEYHILRNVPSDTIYLTPALDGWILVFGHGLPADFDTPLDSLTALLSDLSRRFESAHWYHRDLYGEHRGYTNGWAIAERGELIRYYKSGETPADSVRVGLPHPAEQGFTLPGVDPRHDNIYGNDFTYCNAETVAAHASIDRSEIGPHTRISGCARIAVRPETSLPLGAFVY